MNMKTNLSLLEYKNQKCVAHFFKILKDTVTLVSISTKSLV